MKQYFHSIIKPRPDGSYIGWVEEVPGTVTSAPSIDECRRKLRDALALMIETNRSEARMWMDSNCLQEMLEMDCEDEPAVMMH